MADATIPVDLFNPGQVFACLGFMEAADILLGDAEGGFDWSETGQDRFRLQAAGSENPVEAVLAFLAAAVAEAIGPPDGALLAKEDGIRTALAEPGVYPCARPDTPSALPCRLVSIRHKAMVPISHWIDRSSAGIDNVKFWAGMAGYSGTALVRDMLALVQEWPEAKWQNATTDPFGNLNPTSVSALQSSNLRFDYRSGTIPFDVGFSTNAHSKYSMVGFPLVDLLAGIGLEHARPKRLTKLAYRYGVWSERLPLDLARPVLGAAALGFEVRTFRMELGWPGQENQARVIKSAHEEPPT